MHQALLRAALPALFAALGACGEAIDAPASDPASATIQVQPAAQPATASFAPHEPADPAPITPVETVGAARAD